MSVYAVSRLSEYSKPLSIDEPKRHTFPSRHYPSSLSVAFVAYCPLYKTIYGVAPIYSILLYYEKVQVVYQHLLEAIKLIKCRNLYPGASSADMRFNYPQQRHINFYNHF
jgi:hypothetical protein